MYTVIEFSIFLAALCASAALNKLAGPLGDDESPARCAMGCASILLAAVAVFALISAIASLDDLTRQFK